jgi:hypothetical protein
MMNETTAKMMNDEQNFEWNKYRANVQLYASRIQGVSAHKGLKNDLARRFFEQEMNYTSECVQLLEDQLPQAKLYYTQMQQLASVEEINLLKELEPVAIDPVLKGNDFL